MNRSELLRSAHRGKTELLTGHTGFNGACLSKGR